ncbi:MAG: DUF4230 domain-containing protein [Chitinophagaceae bacterium]|nr:DUF4230 domain-containing protein [Chitinophagaceae bacterium]
MLKTLIKYIVFAAIVILMVILFKDKWFSSIANVFKPKPVVIAETPILIKQINELAQLCTITVFDEVVTDSSEIRKKSTIEVLLPDLSDFGTLPVTGRRIVIIAKGKIIAGTDLKKLQPQSVFIQKDSVSLTLPAAEILDAIINPSDIEIFSEVGVWNDREITAVKIKARNKMIDRAIQQQVLNKADERSIMLMENFLRGAGFKKVFVKVS